MKQHIQITLLALSIPLMFSCWNVNADNATTPKPAIEAKLFYDPPHTEVQLDQRFLPSPLPGGLSYGRAFKASANIDGTPEKETVVSIIADGRGSVGDGNWGQAYLLITMTEAGVTKKKDLFKLFDVDGHDSDVPMKLIDLKVPRFIFTVRSKYDSKPHGVSFTLIDLTGDGILDIWVEFAYAVAVISFQDGEFKEIFSSYTYTHRGGAEYIDLDNDGSYELKIPHRVYLDGFTRSSHPIWMNLYEWDGTAYVLNNEKFYTQDNDIFFKLLSTYNHHLRLRYKYQLALETKDPILIQRLHPVNIQKVDASRYFEVYDFYIGLGHYFRGELFHAQRYLQSVATEAKNREYRSAADNMLKELWNKTDNKEFFISSYKSYLVGQFGNIPQVDTFVAGKIKWLSGSFKFPGDEEEFLKFYEANYALWKNKTVLSELEKIRKAKAEGTPLHLIDLNDKKND